MTRRTLFICFSLALLTLGLFLRAARFDFITYDDQSFIVRNPHVITGFSWSNVIWAFTTRSGGNWEPLTWLSHMADAQFFGGNAGGHHLTNVLFHTANAILLFFVLLRFTGSEWRSAFVAALFAIHPLHVESVAWVAERKDVLSGFFFLLALGAYSRYAAQPSLSRYLLVGVCFLLGLAAKPMVLTLPFVLLLLDFWPLRRLTKSRDFGPLALEKLPLACLSIIIVVVTFATQKAGGFIVSANAYPISRRLANVLISYAACLEHVFWPHDLVLPYPLFRSIDPWELSSTIALLLLVSLIAFFTAKRRPSVLMGWLWFLGMLVPVIALVQFETHTMADRFTYLPAIGIFIGVTWSAGEVISVLRLPRFAAVCPAAAVLAVLGWLTSIQLGYWKNSQSLFGHAVAINPRNPVALGNLGMACALQNRFAEAVHYLRLAVEARPNEAEEHFLLAQMLEGAGEMREAVNEYETTVNLPDRADNRNIIAALNNLAWVRATASDKTLRNGKEAVRLAQRAGELAPSPGSSHLDTLAAAYAEQGDFQNASATAMRALQLAKASDDKDLCSQIEQRLELYRQQKPYRDLRSDKVTSDE